MEIRSLHTLVIGSGAAGLCAAVRLHAQNVTDLAIYTEGLQMGTSINTGSDKQTYYKLGMYGSEADCPEDMAKDLAAGGSVHGDIALVEAALSPLTFHHLVNAGVPFPHDAFGQYTGYKTDHDPRRRATSCGPYTSRDMCLALTGEVKKRNIEVKEDVLCVKLLTDEKKTRTLGAIFFHMDEGSFEVVRAENIVFATGGPGGLYEKSVYPLCHTGGIGLALEAGAHARNLAESQYGLASTLFRWNVSGSCMQVLPRFISTDKEGGDEKEFLREYFDSVEAMYDAIFLKGYQWPFAASHLPGSSLIDIFTYIETEERGRRVFLDYRTDPADLDINKLSPETREYLENSHAVAESPIERLRLLNSDVITLYKNNRIDITKDPLEIAVCAQHNNGGLAGNVFWESENLRHFFPVGEVNGSHGVTRPGGSALNAGQAGAFRASEYIARVYHGIEEFPEEEFVKTAQENLSFLMALQQLPALLDWREERKTFQKRMSRAGAFIRSTPKVEEALDEVYPQYEKLMKEGIGGLAPRDAAESLRNRSLCYAQIIYLENILMQIDYVGSRGGAIVLSPEGEKIHKKLSEEWKMAPEKMEYRKVVMMTSFPNLYPQISFAPCREIPEVDGWFENDWKDFRSGAIFQSRKEEK